MVREGKVVRSRTDYILGTDRSLFRNVSVQYPRHNTDHFMVVGCLRSALEKERTCYIRGRRKMPLRPPTDPMREDGIFAALRRAVPKPHARDTSTRESPRDGGRGFKRGFRSWAAPYGQAYRAI